MIREHNIVLKLGLLLIRLPIVKPSDTVSKGSPTSLSSLYQIALFDACFWTEASRKKITTIITGKRIGV